MKNISWQSRKGKCLSLFGLLQFLCLITIAQVRISGKVTGPSGAALPSISVQVSNAAFGTSTDGSGEFTLNANLRDGNYTLNFTGVGFKPLSRQINILSIGIVSTGTNFSQQVEHLIHCCFWNIYGDARQQHR